MNLEEKHYDDDERIFSAETYARLCHQLAHYFEPDYLAGNEQALKLFRKNNGYTLEDVNMQGITHLEIIDLVDQFLHL